MPTNNSFKFYSSSLFGPIVAPLDFVFDAGGGTAPQVMQLFFGSSVADRKLKEKSGTTPVGVHIQVLDTDGSGPHTTAEVKLASTQAGLASAVAGASLQLASGFLTSGGFLRSVWVEVSDPVLTAGYTHELRLITNEVVDLFHAGGEGGNPIPLGGVG